MKRRKYGSNREQVIIAVSVFVIVLAAYISLVHSWSNFMTLFFHSAGAVAAPHTGPSQPLSTSASTTVDKPGKPLSSRVNYTLMSIKRWDAPNSISSHFHHSVGVCPVLLYLIYDVALSSQLHYSSWESSTLLQN